MTDVPKKVLKVIQASTELDTTNKLSLDLREAKQVFSHVVWNTLGDIYFHELQNTRQESNIPSFMIRYVLPFVAVRLEELPEFEIRTMNVFQISRNEKKNTLGTRSKDQLIGKKSFGLSFTVDQESIPAYSPDTDSTYPNINISKGTAVTAVGLVTQYAPPFPTQTSWTFEDEAQSLSMIQKILHYCDEQQQRSVSFYEIERIWKQILKEDRPLYVRKMTEFQPIKDPAQLSAIQFIRDTLGIDSHRADKAITEHQLFNLFLFDQYHQLMVLKNKSHIHHSLLQRAQVHKQQQDQRKMSFTQQLELSEKKQIALKQFNKKDLGKLSKKELEVVETMYKKSISASDDGLKAESVIGISSALSQAVQFQNIKKITYLKEKLGKSICPHLDELAEGVLKKTEVFTKVMETYGLAVDYQLFCKLCGEKLQNIEEEDITLNSQKEYEGNTQDNIDSMVYTGLSRIMVQFVQVSQGWESQGKIITRMLLHFLIPPLQEIWSGLQKIKSIVNELDTVMDIYIAIYSFALLANFIYLNKGKIAFKTDKLRSPSKEKKGGAAPNAPAKIDEQKIVAQLAAKLLMQYKHIDLHNNSVVDTSNIGQLFTRAYTWASSQSLEHQESVHKEEVHPLDNIKKKKSKNTAQQRVLDMLVEFASDKIIEESAIPLSAKTAAFFKKHSQVAEDAHTQWQQSMRDRSKPSANDYAKKFKYKYDFSKRKPKSDNIHSFFVLYELRCPEGDLHEFENGKCSKCSLTTQMLNSRDPDYFKKYMHQFQAYENARQETIKQQFKDIFNKGARAQYKEEKLPASDNNVVVRLSKRIDVSPAFLFSIGLMEGLSLSDIESGKIIPYKEVDPMTASTRNAILLNYIYFLRRQYNVCRNVDRFFDSIPPEHTELLLNQQTKGFEKLPLLEKSTEKKNLQHLLISSDSVSAGYVLLNVFAETFEFILDSFESQGVHAFGKHFAQFALRHIKSTEKIMNFFQLKHIKTTAVIAMDTSREDFDSLIDLPEDNTDDEDAGLDADHVSDEEDKIDTMASLDIDEDLDEDHFEVDLREKED